MSNFAPTMNQIGSMSLSSKLGSVAKLYFNWDRLSRKDLTRTGEHMITWISKVVSLTTLLARQRNQGYW